MHFILIFKTILFAFERSIDMKLTLYAGVAMLASLQPCSAFLIMSSLVAYERFDPIVQPGIVSGHLHAVIGASTFGQTFDPAVWSKARCSTVQIQENKSNYWMPSMMARHDNGSFSALPMHEARTYYMNNVGDLPLRKILSLISVCM